MSETIEAEEMDLGEEMEGEDVALEIEEEGTDGDAYEEELDDAGENEPEPAEPVNNSGQDAAENARQAAMRRQREAQQAQLRQAQIDKSYADMFSGRLNPYTGQPIQTQREYEEYVQRYNEEKVKRGQRKAEAALQEAGIDKSDIDQIISQHPAIRAAQQAAQKAEKAEFEMKRREYEAEFDQELLKIQALDPSIQSVNDLMQGENAAAFLDAVKKGNSLLDSFKLANFDRLSQKRSAAAAQRTRNQINQKGHLQATGQGKGRTVNIPMETLSMYKEAFPDWSDSQIAKHYASRHKE